MKILANDGVSQSGVKKLEEAGFEVIQTKVAQNQLENYLNENDIRIILVRSATEIRKDLIDACNLQLIGRGGVGLDNIDVNYALEKGISVINTPAASSRSVAELVFAHLFGGVRFLHQANREMPLEGEANFKKLKKGFKGRELKGKTLGILGFGKIGREVAKIALGIGMKVVINDNNTEENEEVPLELEFAGNQKIKVNVKSVSKENLLKTADFVSLHVPAQKDYVIGAEEIKIMKKSAGLINAARGGVVDEVALDIALDERRLSFAALDVFSAEPKPPVKLLMNPDISLSPHIGGSTDEAQERIGVELADQIIAKFGKQK